MKKIILCTNMSSIKKHWSNALSDTYECIHVEDEEDIVKHIQSLECSIEILLDELSVKDIRATLDKLKKFSFIKILLFNAVPEVHHASTLIGENIRGYENSFIHKRNLLKMLESIDNGKNWLFKDLTNYIINKFIQNSSQEEPLFLQKLTPTEKDIALMVSNGLTNKEIVQAKKIALSTVKGHMCKIFEKADVSDRVSLALKFK